MKTNFTSLVKLFTLSTLILCIRCTKDNSNVFTIATESQSQAVQPTIPIQPGIYKQNTYLKTGIAYSWFEVNEKSDLDKMGLIIPIKNLNHQFTFSNGSDNAGTLEINMPDTRGILAFDQILLTYSSREQSTGLLRSPHIQFNFNFNSSRSNCPVDCDPNDPLSRMPVGYYPLLSDGCIMGLGLLWMRGTTTYERNQADILLGSSNDDLAFYSPTATMEVLGNHPDFGGEIPLPITMTSSRFYPTAYKVHQVGNDLHVTFEKFKKRN